MDNEYSHYTVHVCSHMRIVAYGVDQAGDNPGWYHISRSGWLENMSQPCEASIHRTEIEWPKNAMALANQLSAEYDTETGQRYGPTPSTKTWNERTRA